MCSFNLQAAGWVLWSALEQTSLDVVVIISPKAQFRLYDVVGVDGDGKLENMLCSVIGRVLKMTTSEPAAAASLSSAHLLLLVIHFIFSVQRGRGGLSHFQDPT